MNSTFLCGAVVALLTCQRASSGEKWAVHEWGTFTSLQDEAGKAIGGINTDDEPVPPFVHRLASFALLRPTDIPAFFFQGAPSCHPDVTMRLETPVMYFHPPSSGVRSAIASVRVTFHGGWLTEFFPAAEADAFAVGYGEQSRMERRSTGRPLAVDEHVGSRLDVTARGGLRFPADHERRK